MRIELISMLGAIVGASTSLISALYARRKAKRYFLLTNSKDVAWNASEAILENASHDVQDLQIQIERLQKILRETKELQKPASQS